MIRVSTRETLLPIFFLVALAGSHPAIADAASRRHLRVGVVAERDLACALDEGCDTTSRALPVVAAADGGPAPKGLSSRVVSAPQVPGTRRLRRLYLYRLELGTARALSDGCVSDIAFPAGPVAGGVDLDGDGRRGERAVVIDSEGEVAPARAVRAGRQIRFEFSPPLCPGDGASGTGRSTEFGFMSYRSPGLLSAELATEQGSTSIPIWGPKRNPNKVLLDKIKLDVPSRIPEGCGPTPLDDPHLLDCWLDVHYEVAQTISWREVGAGNPIVYWAFWPEEKKADLRAAFFASWAWEQGGFQTYGGPTIDEPPVNQEALFDGEWINTVLTPEDAWKFYVAHLGHSLAAEIFAWVPWSVAKLDNGQLSALFSSEKLLLADTDNGDVYDPVYPGYVFFPGNSTPAHPVTAYDFLRESDLIGPTQAETVGRLLEWSRSNLRHFSGDYTVSNLEAHWGYRGHPPASLIIEGTIRSGEDYVTESEPSHWTAGCYGTTDFLRSVLRVVNIPVFRVQEACAHTMPYFPTLKAYLSHGDDPYDGFSKGTPTFPAAALLVDEATWAEWFLGDPDESCANVGRRPLELSVFWMTTGLVSAYCQDVLDGLDHESGSVAARLAPAYDLAELEAMSLWDDLAVAAAGSSIVPCNQLP